MKIKTKLVISTGFLFLLITLLSALAIRQVTLLANDTKNILVSNYISLEYARNMHKITDAAPVDIDAFSHYLVKQQHNITEHGEEKLTTDLARHFNQLRPDPQNIALIQVIRRDLNNIMKVNMDAIQRKSLTAENTAQSSLWWISGTSAVCLIIGFTLIFNLPGYIANPIQSLTESIRQIAARNYAQRVHFKAYDEFSTLAKSFNTMAEKLQEYNDSNLAQLLIEKKRIETLVNNLHDPVIGLDENNRILFINDKALHVSGLKKEHILGKSLQDVALHNDLIRSLLLNNNDTKGETLKIYADGKESYFEKQLAPINMVPTGETDELPAGSFIILRNVTPYKELDVAKTNFIATVSHEFKTPIASMKLSLQLLDNIKTGTLNKEQRGLIESIKEDADRLLRTTGELLNITQVETGAAQLKTGPADILDIITDAVKATEKLAAQKSVSLNMAVPENLSPILADSEKATWIVSNLISNAIRYSYENSIVTISTRLADNGILLEVADTGTGIAPRYQERIFDKYFRVPGVEKEGTGLGLSISKEFIEAMGGHISVTSTPGNGSTFTVYFKIYDDIDIG